MPEFPLHLQQLEKKHLPLNKEDLWLPQGGCEPYLESAGRPGPKMPAVAGLHRAAAVLAELCWAGPALGRSLQQHGAPAHHLACGEKRWQSAGRNGSEGQHGYKLIFHQ